MNGHHSAGMVSSGYADRLESFRQSDAERESMVTELLRNFESLREKYAQMEDDLGNERESRRMWQSKANSSERAFGELRQVSGSNNFALAVIDGDGAIFNDFLYAQGKDGGADAAHLMHTEIRNHLRSTYPDSNVSDWSIVVHVVLNLQGLGTKLQSCGIISNPNELTAFGRSFGLAQSLFSFIDVGGGKERADHKVRETLRLFLPNAQCKHVFFGPCNDNGYLPVLEPYRRDAATAARLTLIETTPAEPGFAQLGLSRIRMPGVFRSQPLPNRPTSINNNMNNNNNNAMSPSQQMSYPIRGPPPGMIHHRSNTTSSSAAEATPFVPKNPSPSPSAESGGGGTAVSNSWAAVGKNGTINKTIDISTKKAPKRRYVITNAYDERLDPELPAQDSTAYRRFTERVEAHGKCCNNYHLTGKCEAGEYCDYTHGERLSPGEQLVLKHKARSLGCPGKFACRDVACFSGHHCKFAAAGGRECFHEFCRFGDTHGMDFEPAKKVYENGEEEWLAAYLEKSR